jgi:hypothetical protein
MSRSRDSLVVYHENMPVFVASAKDFHELELWLDDELVKLVARWQDLASPWARRVFEDNPQAQDPAA